MVDISGTTLQREIIVKGGWPPYPPPDLSLINFILTCQCSKTNVFSELCPTMVAGEVSTRPGDSVSLTGPGYMEADILVLLSPSSRTGFVGAREAGMLTGKKK